MSQHFCPSDHRRFCFSCFVAFSHSCFGRLLWLCLSLLQCFFNEPLSANIAALCANQFCLRSICSIAHALFCCCGPSRPLIPILSVELLSGNVAAPALQSFLRCQQKQLIQFCKTIPLLLLWPPLSIKLLWTLIRLWLAAGCSLQIIQIHSCNTGILAADGPLRLTNLRAVFQACSCFSTPFWN